MTGVSASQPRSNETGHLEDKEAPLIDCQVTALSLRDLGRKRIERGEVWKYKETKSLLAIWSSSETQHQLSTLRRNKSVWQLIALKLKSAGYRRTWVQCKNRIANLIKLYKKATKDKHDSSGPFRSAEPFFKELNKTLNEGHTAGTADVITDGFEDHQYTNDCDSLYLVQSALESTLEEVVDDCSPHSSDRDKEERSPSSVGGGCGDDDSLSDGNHSDPAPETAAYRLRSSAPFPRKKKRKSKLGAYHQTMLEQFRLLIGEVEKRFYEFEERREMRWLEELERQRNHELQMEMHRLEHEARESKRTEDFFKLMCEKMCN